MFAVMAVLTLLLVGARFVITEKRLAEAERDAERAEAEGVPGGLSTTPGVSL